VEEKNEIEKTLSILKREKASKEQEIKVCEDVLENGQRQSEDYDKTITYLKNSYEEYRVAKEALDQPSLINVKLSILY